jgi:hypothetical protein
MAGSYSTDLTLIDSGASGGGTDTTAYSDLTNASLGDADTDNAYQGTTSLVGLGATQANRGFSLVTNAAGNITLNAGEVFSVWGLFAGAGVLSSSAANPPGIMVVVGTATNAISTYVVGGSDTYSAGGWRNYVVDLRNTPTGPDNSGATGNSTSNTNQYYGIAFYQLNSVNRSLPVNLDAPRHGRMIFTSTGGDNTSINNASPLSSSAANFPQMADYDDYNAGGTPTFGSAVDGGFHRFGQVVFKEGVYVCKGIIRLGVNGGSSTYFDDTSRSISFEDTPDTYADFNRFEIANASSTVVLDSMTFTGLGTTSRGNFEMIDNASVDFDSCSFLDMGTFIFQSNATIDDSSFRRCNTITTGGAAFTNCTFSRSNNSIATSASTTADFDGCTFVSDGTGYAIDLGTITGTVTQNVNCTFTGYDPGTDANGGSGGNANSTIRVNLASGNSLTLQVASGTSVPTVDNIAGSPGTLTVVQTVNYTVENIRSGTNLQLIEDNGGTLTTIGGVDNVSASPSGVDSGFSVSTDPNNAGRFRVVYQYGYSADRNIYVAAVNVDFQSVYLSDVLGNTDDSIRITQVTDRQYDPGSV